MRGHRRKADREHSALGMDHADFAPSSGSPAEEQNTAGDKFSLFLKSDWRPLCSKKDDTGLLCVKTTDLGVPEALFYHSHIGNKK